MAIKNYNVSIQTKDNTNIRAITGMVQNDADTNVLSIQIINDLDPLDISDYSTITYSVQRPDETIYTDSIGETLEVVDAEKGKLKLILPLECVSLAGEYNLTISIYDGTKRITTAMITYICVADLSASGDPSGEDEFPVLQSLIQQASEVISDINDFKDEVADTLEAMESAEADRVEAEEARVEAEEVRESNESDRVEAEEARADAELDRANAEDVRESNESERQTAESFRNTAEGLREAAEQARKIAEDSRELAEDDRVDAENTRDSNEDDRIAAEAARAAAESLRVTAENARATAEAAREVFEEYDPDTSYVEGNKVAYNGSSYVCLTSTKGYDPEHYSDIWLLIASKGDQGDQGDKGDTGDAATITTNKVGKTTTLTITDNNGTHYATILDGADGQGTGDMLTNVYDPTNKAQDIFAYVDNHVDSTLTDRMTQAEYDIDDLESELADINIDVTNIQSVIPDQASNSNKLADKNFVNSSISTNTATFRGNFDSVAELQSYSGDKTNNDYAYVKTTGSDGLDHIVRYKYNGTSWVEEFDVNNSIFTAAQFAWLNTAADGTTIVNSNGVLSATAQTPSIATTTTAGIVKPDGTTINVTSDGTITAIGGLQYEVKGEI